MAAAALAEVVADSECNFANVTPVSVCVRQPLVGLVRYKQARLLNKVNRSLSAT